MLRGFLSKILSMTYGYAYENRLYPHLCADDDKPEESKAQDKSSKAHERPITANNFK